MTAQIDLDQVLAAWLDEGPQQAPERFVAAAMKQVDGIAQRKPIRIWSAPSGLARFGAGRRAALMAALVGLLVLIAGLGLQFGLIRLPAPTPSPTEVPLLVRGPFGGAAFAVPLEWHTLDRPGIQTWQYGGTNPDGTLSVSFGTPVDVIFCSRRCTPLTFELTDDYDPAEALQMLSARVSRITRETRWDSMPVVPAGFVAAISQERLVEHASWGESRELVVLAAAETRVVALTWTQPVAAFDRTLFSDILATVTSDPGAGGYSRRAGVINEDGGFELYVPELWYAWTRPQLGDHPAAGVWRYGDRELTISIGDADGTIRLCDVSCAEFHDQSSSAALERTLSAWLPAVPPGKEESSGEVGLLWETARYLARDVQSERGERVRYVAYGTQAGRPFVISFDVPSNSITAGALEEIVGSFVLMPPPSGSRDVTVTGADGSIGLDLRNSAWEVTSGPDAGAIYLRGPRVCSDVPVCGPMEASVRMGDANGWVRPCDQPAPPMLPEHCTPFRARTREELVDGVGLRWDAPGTFLDGELAVRIDLAYYEYPAAGAQYLTYVLAVHDHRPVVIRYWSPTTPGVERIDEVLAAFRFLD